MIAVPIPNEVLDLSTLRLARVSVAAQRRLIAGGWSKFRTLFGIPVGVDYCAVGSMFKPFPGDAGRVADAYFNFYRDYDVEPTTVTKLIEANDVLLRDVTPEDRRNLMLDFIDRAIAYAENVKHEMETLASSSAVNRVTQLAVDKAEAQGYVQPSTPCDDCEYAKTGELVAA